jgi:hypothetical protein
MDLHPTFVGVLEAEVGRRSQCVPKSLYGV